MRRAILLLVFALAGCGPQTPLSHAIAAFRAGDSAGLAAAQDEAVSEVAGAVQPADMCALTMDDLRKYSELGRIKLLNDARILRLPEEDRLVWALKIAGQTPKITDEPRLAQSPLYKASIGNDSSALQACKVNPLLQMAGSDEKGEAERSDALKGWIADTNARLADRFEARMIAAADDLARQGYEAVWPVPVEFFGDAPQTFSDVQRKLQN